MGIKMWDVVVSNCDSVRLHRWYIVKQDSRGLKFYQRHRKALFLVRFNTGSMSTCVQEPIECAAQAGYDVTWYTIKSSTSV